jgi:cytochrome c
MEELKMRAHKTLGGISILASSLLFLSGNAFGSEGGKFSFGTPATPEQISGWNIDVLPDGQGLPSGSGTALAGSKLYAEKCAACHGDNGQGVPVSGRGAFPKLVGGIGTLGTDSPVKTVGSFWPYATGVFDYIRRAMPFNNPQSLSNNEVYALTAFVLYKNGIINKDAEMNAKSLPLVKMPNRNGFYQRPKPETDNVATYFVSGN